MNPHYPDRLLDRWEERIRRHLNGEKDADGSSGAPVSQQLAGEVTSALPDCVLCRGTGEICSVVGDGRSHWVETTPCRCQVKIPSCDPVKITD